MRNIPKMSSVDIAAGLKIVLSKLEQASQKRIPEYSLKTPRLVAVSKTKPNEAVIAAYEAGQRHFGENYVQELVDKATSEDILEQCKDIRWHFIGHLQTNKINKVLSVPNLYMVETVHEQKLAANLNKNWPKFGAENSKLKVYIQVNTSGEIEKSGISPTEVTEVAKFIIEKCTHLHLEGLMTIGQYGYDLTQGPNPDFIVLKKCRDDVAKDLNLDWKDLDLSMGMSNDFEHAIGAGSTNVRVGSEIFGHREKKA